jgi:hypothetical protein
MAARGEVDGAAALVDQCEREFRSGLAALDVYMARNGQGR